ncbi:MAG: fatty acid desaturase [Pirellulales bacterium]
MSLRITPTEAAAVKSFSLPQARNAVRDLFAPKAWIFWSDFLLSFAVGNVCFALTRKQVFLSWQQVGLFLVAALLFYRAVLFIHEIVHLRTGTFKTFRFVWNLICGIPMLVPSFLYYTHLDHHSRNHYGTDFDGEYIPLASRSRLSILLYMLQPFVMAPLAIVRFMILTPLTWVSPAAKRFIFEHMSTMIMDPTYVRPMPTTKVLRVCAFRNSVASCGAGPSPCFSIAAWIRTSIRPSSIVRF